jgi:hypothetical protein
MHNITFVNKAIFLKVYNNFVLKWLILALCVVVVPEQILLGSIWGYSLFCDLEDTLRICDVSAKGLLRGGRRESTANPSSFAVVIWATVARHAPIVHGNF